MRLKWWFKSGFENGLIAVFGAVVYVVSMLLMGAEGGTRKLLQMASVMMLLFGAGMGVLLCATVWKINLPVALNFGATRREAFCGMLCHQLVYNTAVFGVSAVLFIFSEKAEYLPWGRFVPISIGVLLLAAAVGTVLGVLSSRASKTVQIAAGVLIGLLGAGGIIGGMVLAMAADEMLFQGSSWGFWLFPAVSLVIYGLSIIPERRAIYRFVVKL